MADTEKEARASAQQDAVLGHDTSAAVQLAHEVDTTEYSPFSKTMIRLYLILIPAYLCGCLNGYDGSLMGGLNGMTAYQHYFNM